MTFAKDLRSDLDSLSDPFSHSRGLDLPAFVRVNATLRLTVAGLASRITERREDGALRFRFPRAHGRPPEAMIVNIAGGLAGGDQVLIDVGAHDGARLSLSSAAAERIYTSAGANTRLTTMVSASDEARLVWLPQETILHDGACMERRVEIDLSPSASVLFGDMLYFGRRASGEAMSHGLVRESWRVRREGRLILADETRLDGTFSDTLTRKAALGAHVALATVLFAAPELEGMLDSIRALLSNNDAIEAGATDLGGLIFVRLMSEDGAVLRRAFLALTTFLCARMGQPMPRALLT